MFRNFYFSVFLHSQIYKLTRKIFKKFIKSNSFVVLKLTENRKL